jgi:anhydro-N-acetylmuramic acid kinase
VRGFDCGPGNALLDFWIQRELGKPYDEGGRWGAAAGSTPRCWHACWTSRSCAPRRRRAPAAICSTRRGCWPG